MESESGTRTEIAGFQHKRNLVGKKWYLMVYYTAPRPKVYIETTVVSYLVAWPSLDSTVASWQQATRQLWEDYADRFEFVVSDIVLDEREP